jgi:thiol reductant ABC exporter CydD subunit
VRPVDPRLLRTARGATVHLVSTVCIGAAVAVLVVTQASVLSSGLSRVIEHGGTQGLAPLLIGLLVVVALRAVLVWLQEVVAQRAAATVKSDLRRRLTVVALTPRSDGAGSRRAEVVALTGGGLDGLDSYFSKYLPQLVLAVVVPTVVLGQLLRYDLTAALTVGLTLPLIPLFMVLVGRVTEAANARRWDALERLSHHFLDVIEGMPTLRAFGRGRAQAELVRESTDHYRSTTMATLRVAFLSSLVLETLATLSVALVAVGVGVRLVDGGLDLRTGLLLILLAPEAYLPLRQVGAHYHSAAAGLAAADRTFALLDQPVEATRGGDALDGPLVRVSVHGVSVRHPDRPRPAPDGARLDVNAGEIVAVAGPSGAGKSTLLAVLLGLQQPDEGTVLVTTASSTVPLSTLDVDGWRAALSWVDQQPYLFAGTLGENVRLSQPDASDEQVVDAIRRAGLTLSVDRVLAAGGTDLSAGERRRVGVARALVREASLVVLDEPTAGLDAATEADVVRALRDEARRGAAVVVVSHRPAVLESADRVVRVG